MATKQKAAESSDVQPKKTTWNDIKHFNPVDFSCKCDGLCDHKPRIDMELAEKLDAIAEEIGLPMTVLAGTRCKAFNFKCRGISTSALVPDQSGVSHGVEFGIVDDAFRYRIVAAAVSAGIKRIVLRRESIYLDDTPGVKESLRVDLTRK